MAQHDYDIANQSGQAFRQDLNNALLAIVSRNSGASAPSTTYAYQTWYDTSTTPATIKLRDGSNASWITIGYADGTYNSITAASFIPSSSTVPTNGIYLPGANTLGIATNSAKRIDVSSSGTTTLTSAASTAPLVVNVNTTEALRVDSSSRLLVGTNTAPSASGGVYSLLVVQGYVGNSTQAGDISIQCGTAAASLTSGTQLGVLRFNDSAGNTFAKIDGVTDAASGTNDYPGRLVFSTCPDNSATVVERMRISQNGQTNIFSSDNGLVTRVSAGAGTSTAIHYGTYSATNNTNGTVSFVVWSNGNVQNTNNSYGAYSDAKLKENIVDASSQWNDLKALRVRKYNLKEGQTHTQIGLVAQEVELVSPGLVTETPDRDAEGNETGEVTKGVNYSVLYMKAVKALQEAMERIEQLEAEMAEVKAQLS